MGPITLGWRIVIIALIGFGVMGCSGGGEKSAVKTPTTHQEAPKTEDETKEQETLPNPQDGIVSDGVGVRSIRYRLEGANLPSIERTKRLFTGRLKAKELERGEEHEFFWSAYIDAESFEMVSSKTIVLPAGTYRMHLFLENNQEQYVGEGVYTLRDEESIALEMAVKPVVGEALVDVSGVDQLKHLQFHYDSSVMVTYDQPRLAVRVGNDPIQWLSINPETGFSETYFNLPEGNYSIGLDLYDGTRHKARATEYPKEVELTTNTLPRIDLRALYGEADFLIEGGEKGALNMRFLFPPALIDAAGGSHALQATLTYRDAKGEVGSMVLPESRYEGEVWRTDVRVEEIGYGEFSYEIRFASTSRHLGSCAVAPFFIGKDPASAQCELDINANNIITGDLLASIGITVYDAHNTPLNGALIYAGERFLGISASDSNGGEGYFATTLPQGHYLFTIEHDQKRQQIKDERTEFKALERYNIALSFDPESTKTPLTLQSLSLKREGHRLYITPEIAYSGSGYDLVYDAKLEGTSSLWDEEKGHFILSPITNESVGEISVVIRDMSDGLSDTLSLQFNAQHYPDHDAPKLLLVPTLITEATLLSEGLKLQFDEQPDLSSFSASRAGLFDQSGRRLNVRFISDSIEDTIVRVMVDEVAISGALELELGIGIRDLSGNIREKRTLHTIEVVGSV